MFILKNKNSIRKSFSHFLILKKLVYCLREMQTKGKQREEVIFFIRCIRFCLKSSWKGALLEGFFESFFSSFGKCVWKNLIFIGFWLKTLSKTRREASISWSNNLKNISMEIRKIWKAREIVSEKVQTPSVSWFHFHPSRFPYFPFKLAFMSDKFWKEKPSKNFF